MHQERDGVALIETLDGELHRVGSELGIVALETDRFRTTAGHAEHLVQIGWPSANAALVDQAAQALRRLRIIVTRKDFIASLRRSDPGEDPPRIRSQIWITRDRPESLAKSVEGFAANALRHAHPLEIVVSDDSEDARSVASTRALLGRLANEGHSVAHFGRREKEALAADLERALGGTVSHDDIVFALFSEPDIPGPTIGANRNAALLARPVGLSLLTDDDAFCRAAFPDAGANDVRLSSLYLPDTIHPFPSREELWRERPQIDADFLADHASLLGRSIGSLISDDADLCDVRPRMVADLMDRGGIVRATGTGVIGDLGSDSPKYLLSTVGDEREVFLGDESTYRSAKRSREVFRCSNVPTVTEGTFLGGFFLGIDQRIILPPFVPVGRNEDILFAALTRVLYPSTYYGHAPIAYDHSPDPRRQFSDGWLDDLMPKSNELLPIVFATFRRDIAISDHGGDADRFLSAADKIAELSHDPRQFAELIQTGWLRAARSIVRRIEANLETYHYEPSYWATDLERAIETYSALIDHPDQVAPADFPGSTTDRLELLRSLCLRYGRLLAVWPDIMSSARRRAERRVGE